MKSILAIILLSCAAMAQNDAAIDKAKSACGLAEFTSTSKPQITPNPSLSLPAAKH